MKLMVQNESNINAKSSDTFLLKIHLLGTQKPRRQSRSIINSIDGFKPNSTDNLADKWKRMSRSRV